jgi:thiol-disulfide isomerase/thioredoxin
MPYLIAAVIVVGALCVLDLLLTLGVIRRLREHTELLSRRPTETGTSNAIIAAGQTPGAFAAEDTDGLSVRHDDGRAPQLVGFFSPDCPACRELLPKFVEHAARYPGGRPQVLAVVTGSGPGVDDLAGQLTGVARVVVEEAGGPVSAAFQVTGSPAWCVLDEHGVVQDGGLGFDRLPLAVPA